MKQLFQPYLSAMWPAIIWSAIVFILLAMPGKRMPGETWVTIMHIDKLVHAFFFFVLVWLWAVFLKNEKVLTTSLLIYLAAAATLYGIALEFVQIYTGRDFSVGDMLADGAGAFLAAITSRGKK
jgi:VanZ family protein